MSDREDSEDAVSSDTRDLCVERMRQLAVTAERQVELYGRRARLLHEYAEALATADMDEEELQRLSKVLLGYVASEEGGLVMLEEANTMFQELIEQAKS